MLIMMTATKTMHSFDNLYVERKNFCIDYLALELKLMSFLINKRFNFSLNYQYLPVKSFGV